MPPHSKPCPGCGVIVTIEEPHGLFAFGKDLPLHCDPCAERLWAEYQRRQRAEEMATRYGNLLARELVTPQFRDAAFSRSNREIEAINPDPWKAARGWDGRNSNVCIYGPTGTGKSYMARCLLKRIFFAGRDVAEVSARRFCKTSDTFAEGRGMYNAWKTAPGLLIDDIDKTEWNHARVSSLWELLDARSTGQCATVVTGNVSPSDLMSLLRRAVRGEMENVSIVDATLQRLKPCLTLQLIGKSLR